MLYKNIEIIDNAYGGFGVGGFSGGRKKVVPFFAKNYIIGLKGI